MKKKLVLVFSIISMFLLSSCLNSNASNQIKVYTRDTNSGTRGAFFELIGLPDLASSNEALVNGYVQVESNGAMMASINNDKNGIGYISLSGLEGSGLKGLSFNGITASEENVLNGTYTLKRPFMYIRRKDSDITDEKEKQLVDAFIAFMYSKDGLEIIKNNDGIVEGLDQAQSWDSIKENHPIINDEGNKVEIHFGGSTSVEKISKALSSAFLAIAPIFDPKHNHTGSGAASTGTNDKTLHIGFASRELKETETTKAGINNYGRIAYDAVVIVVNMDNKLTNITTEAIKGIYTGTITSFKELS